MHKVSSFARITGQIGKFTLRLPFKFESGHTALFQRMGSVECTAYNNVMYKCFSILRWSYDKDPKESDPAFDDVNLPERSEDNVNKTTWSWSPAHAAAFLGLYECFHNKKLKKDINYQMMNTQLSPLMAAVLGKHTQCVSVLLEHGARLDLQDQNGETVYHYAVSHHPEVIPILAKHDDPKGSDRVINYLNKNGLTALATACEKGKPEIVQLLLDEDADPNITGQDMYPIHHAVKNGDTRSVDVICKKFKDQLSKRDKKFGGTPLHWARDRKMIEKCCRLKADINMKSNTGHTPLHIMQRRDRTDCLIELLCWGADPSIGDEEGNTPVHIAVLKDDLEMVKTFAVCGADVNVKNKKNQSPRHIASTLDSKNKDLILYVLHTSGAVRCDENMENCEDGCSKSGEKNGKVDGDIIRLLQSDQSGPLDEMFASVFDPLAQIDGSEEDPGYRILSLDGGGIRGLVQCLMLIAIEKEVGKPITECFDWIAGTSTGGLLTLGICTGKPLPYMRGLYIRLKDEVFTGTRPYESENFEALLKEEFGEETVMTNFKKPRAVVTAVLADRHPTKLHLFRTYEPTFMQLYDSKSGSQSNVSTHKKDDICLEEGDEEIYCPVKPGEQKVWEAARATGAAPTYFKAFGPYIDGGLDANNPSLDLLSEIHEYNCGLKINNESELVRPIGVMVSLGTGQVPVHRIDTIDVYKPEGIFDVTKIAHGIQNLINVMVDKATIAEGRPVDRARAWCGTLGVPFYRFSPPITEVEMDEHDNRKLIQLMWETQCYIVANQDRIKKLASFLRRNT